MLMRKQPARNKHRVCKAGFLQDAAALLVQTEDAPQALIFRLQLLNPLLQLRAGEYLCSAACKAAYAAHSSFAVMAASRKYSSIWPSMALQQLFCGNICSQIFMRFASLSRTEHGAQTDMKR